MSDARSATTPFLMSRLPATSTTSCPDLNPTIAGTPTSSTRCRAARIGSSLSSHIATAIRRTCAAEPSSPRAQRPHRDLLPREIDASSRSVCPNAAACPGAFQQEHRADPDRVVALEIVRLVLYAVQSCSAIATHCLSFARQIHASPPCASTQARLLATARDGRGDRRCRQSRVHSPHASATRVPRRSRLPRPAPPIRSRAFAIDALAGGTGDGRVCEIRAVRSRRGPEAEARAPRSPRAPSARWRFGG